MKKTTFEQLKIGQKFLVVDILKFMQEYPEEWNPKLHKTTYHGIKTGHLTYTSYLGFERHLPYCTHKSPFSRSVTITPTTLVLTDESYSESKIRITLQDLKNSIAHIRPLKQPAKIQ